LTIWQDIGSTFTGFRPEKRETHTPQWRGLWPSWTPVARASIWQSMEEQWTPLLVCPW